MKSMEEDYYDLMEEYLEVHGHLNGMPSFEGYCRVFNDIKNRIMNKPH